MFLSLIDNDENAIDCKIACDCVKRANVVLGIRRDNFARTHTATHKPASAQRLKVTIVTLSVEPQGLRPGGAISRH